MIKIYIFFFICFFSISHCSEQQLNLIENFSHAKSGDFVVISRGKTYILFHIFDKYDGAITIEEVTVPVGRMQRNKYSWHEWLSANAPYNTSWVMYQIDTNQLSMSPLYSFSKNSWYQVPESEQFLPTLLQLQYSLVPKKERTSVGFASNRPWQPKMIVGGKVIPNVNFHAWKTKWPVDGSDLSGKQVLIYLPETEGHYPSYFPYWLEISGTIGKGRARVIDSGSGLQSPKGSPWK